MYQNVLSPGISVGERGQIVPVNQEAVVKGLVGPKEAHRMDRGSGFGIESAGDAIVCRQIIGGAGYIHVVIMKTVVIQDYIESIGLAGKGFHARDVTGDCGAADVAALA